MNIDINLLPWREQQRERHQKCFFLSLAGAVLVAALGGLGMTYHYAAAEQAQQQRNAHILERMRELEGDIRLVDAHEVARGRMMERVQSFSALQQARLQTVRLLHALTQSLVDGVHYTELSRQGTQLHLVGLANSNHQVFEQMRALAAVPGVSEPALSEVEAAAGGERRRFSLGMTQFEPPRGEAVESEEGNS